MNNNNNNSSLLYTATIHSTKCHAFTKVKKLRPLVFKLNNKKAGDYVFNLFSLSSFSLFLFLGGSKHCKGGFIEIHCKCVGVCECVCVCVCVSAFFVLSVI